MEAVKHTPATFLGNFHRKLTSVLETLLALCLLVMLLTILLLVLLRYVFNLGIVGANEMVTILFVYTTAIGSAVAVGKKEHVAVEFLIDKLSPSWRTSADIFGYAGVAILNAIMLWHSIRWIHVTGDYLMPATQLPRFYAQASVPIGCGLAVLYAVVRIVSALKSSRENAAG